MQIEHARATSERSLFYIVDGNSSLEYIQRSFKQGSSIGTGTTSDGPGPVPGPAPRAKPGPRPVPGQKPRPGQELQLWPV